MITLIKKRHFLPAITMSLNKPIFGFGQRLQERSGIRNNDYSFCDQQSVFL